MADESEVPGRQPSGFFDTLPDEGNTQTISEATESLEGHTGEVPELTPADNELWKKVFPENSIDQGNVMGYTTKDAMALDDIVRTNLETFKASDKEVPALEEELAESIDKGPSTCVASLVASGL